MILEPEQFEWLADATEELLQHAESEHCAAASLAREIAAAMRTPITDAALRADGWTHPEDWAFNWWHKEIDGTSIDIGTRDGLGVLVEIDNSGEAFATNARTMYDLSEIFRLFGGTQ